jgi:hypothetical protein
VTPDRLGAASEAIDATMPGSDPGDRAIEFSRAGREWRLGAAAPQFRAAVRAALEVGFDHPTLGAKVGREFLTLHAELRATDGLSFEEASALLSHTGHIVQLAEGQRYSASQIARVLSGADERAGFRRETVQTVLRKLGLLPALDPDDVDQLVWEDALLEEIWFGDATLATSLSMVASAAEDLSFPGDCAPLLRALAPTVAEVNGPLLRLLFYQCVVAQFFDHPPSHLYEFSPRGAIARKVFGVILDELPGGANAALNVSKSIHVLDEGWARGRQERAAALALAELVHGLDSMGLAARQELAAWLRRWVLLVIRVRQPLLRAVPTTPTAADIANVLNSVAAGETFTYGIVEQRVLDAVAAAAHLETAGWRSRGIGDPVNASNLSRKKFGDVEFIILRPAAPELVGYEAHAGRLTTVYIEAHLATLEPILERRREELETIEPDAAKLTIRVIFVAHEIPPQMSLQTINGFTIQPEAQTFAAYFASAPTPSTASFADQVNALFNQSRTPQKVRDWYLEVV